MASRNREFRRRLRRLALVATGLFLLVNGCSWDPGYGGRHDRKPGFEVERSFGWPCCYYADLWRTERPVRLRDFEPWDYAPPLPITNQTRFVYCSFGAVPLLLNGILVLAMTGLVLILLEWESRERLPPRIALLGGLLAIVSWAIIKFGDLTSVYL